MADAAALVPDGALVATGGMGLCRKPVALTRALVATRKRDLRILTLAGSVEVEMLVAAGCVASVQAAFVALDVFGPARAWRSAVESNTIRHLDETLHSLTARLRATAAGITFMPGLPIGDSDIVADRDDVAVVECPFTGRRYPAWAAVIPDVALLHAAEADTKGNIVLGGHPGIDALLAATATTTVVSAERIVDNLEHDGVADIPGLHVDALVPAPGGAAPTSCEPAYSVDHVELELLASRCTADGLAATGAST